MSNRQNASLAGIAVATALALVVGLTPATAWAVYYQYALNAPTAENVSRVSVAGVVIGGRANLAWGGSFRTYIQTTNGATLVGSAYTNTGFTDVYLSNPGYSGSVSRCHWDFLGGTWGGQNLKLNCWRQL